MADFEILDSRTLCDAGFLRVTRLLVAGPDGSEFERHVVRHPGAVVVVPVDDDGEHVFMVRQFRVAIADHLLELPAGKRDVDDEPPEATAARELEEELGVRASDITLLCEFYNSPGFTDEYSYAFLARGLTPSTRTATSAEEAEMSIERVALRDVDALIASRAIVDAKSVIGLLVARGRLAEAGPA